MVDASRHVRSVAKLRGEITQMGGAEEFPREVREFLVGGVLRTVNIPAEPPDPSFW
jgi:hypothetical protein